MKYTSKSLAVCIAVYLVSACSDGVDVSPDAGTENLTAEIASGQTSLVLASAKTGEPQVAAALAETNDFQFATVTERDGGFEITIPAGPKPSFSTRSVVVEGDGDALNYGDTVTLAWDMYSWSTGDVVNSSADLIEPLQITLGANPPVPDFVEQSLINRKAGSTLQVVLKPGIDDLPLDLDREDAYVLLLRADKI